MTDAKPKHLGRLRCRFEESSAIAVVEQALTGGVNLGLTQEIPAESAGLRERVVKAVGQVPPATVADDVVALLQQKLVAEGLTVERMPHDVQVKIHLNLVDGTSLTQTSAIDGGAAPSESLQRDMARLALKAVRKVLLGSVEKMQQALLGEDAQAFVNAIPREVENDDVAAFEAHVVEAARKPTWADKRKVIYLVAGDTALRAKRTEAALAWGREALDLPGDDPDLDFNLRLHVGSCYGILGNLSSAKLEFEAALARWPNVRATSRAWAFHNLGTTRFQMGQPDEGAAAYEEAARLRALAGDPLEPARTLARAAHKRELFNPFVALVQYDKALAALPSTEAASLGGAAALLRAQLQFARGRVLLEEAGQPDRALDALKTAAELFRPILEAAGAYASVLMWQAVCLARLGEHEAAAAVRGEGETFAADAGELLSARVQAAFAGAAVDEPGQREQVAAAFGSASRLLPTDLPGALAALENGVQLERASASPNRALEGLMLTFGAHGLWEHGKPEEAASWQQRAVVAYPGSTKLRATLAAFLLASGRYKECHEVASGLASDFPQLPHGHLYAGLAAHRTADYAESIKRLEVVKAMGPVTLAVDAVLDDATAQLSNTPGAATMATIAAQHLVAEAPPLTHRHFLELLSRASRRVGRNSSIFWKSRSERKFNTSPEGIGKALLVQDFSRDPAFRIYDEVQLPGGRMDVTLNVYGTEYILELKMCGGGYARSYAESGFEQLEGYMKARGATRGYLIVFDGRVVQTGEAALPAEHVLDGGRRIFCVSCNILGLEAR